MAAGEIRAGRAYVELFTKDNLLVSGLKAAEAKVKALGSAIAGIGTKFAALGAAIWAPLLTAAKAFADSGSELLLMSQRTGVSVEALSALRYAADRSGVSAEDLEVGFKKMSQTVQAAADGTAAARQSLASLGVTIEELRGLSQDQIFERLATGIAGIQNPTTRAARTLEIFGRSGLTLLPLLNRGAAGIAELRAEAERLGVVKTREQAEAAHQLHLAYTAAQNATKGLWNAIGSALAPALTEAFRALVPLILEVKNWIKENKALFVVLGAVGAVVTGIGTGLLTLAGVIKILALAIAPIGAILSFLLNPITLVIAGISAAVAGVVLFTDQGQRLVSSLSSGFSGLADIFSTTWGGISDAIAASDWAGAVEIAWLGVRAAFASAISSLSIAWRNFAGFFVDVWQEAVTEVGQIIHGLQTGAGNFILGTGAAAVNASGANATSGEIAREAERARRERERQRAEANAQDLAAPNDLLEQLDILRRNAEEARSIAEAQAEARRAGQAAAEGIDESRRKTDIAGTFSAFAAGGLGAGSVTERIASATEQTAANTRQLAQQGGGRFG